MVLKTFKNHISRSQQFFSSRLMSAISLYAQVQFHAKYNILSSVANQTASLPLAMRFYLKATERLYQS